MKRVRVIVEIEVPSTSDLTEKAFGWAIRRAGLPARIAGRRIAVKEFSRVMQWLPGGART